MRLWRAEAAEKPDLARAYTAYMAELCPDEDQADDPYFDLYWQEPSGRLPYLFGEDAALGFAFVRRLDEPDIDFEMAEFCVFPAHRRQGIGASILPHVFTVHPGRWELSILMTNADGLAFWPRALRTAGVLDLRMRQDETARDYRFKTP